jgi:hypothetical protein
MPFPALLVEIRPKADGYDSTGRRTPQMQRIITFSMRGSWRISGLTFSLPTLPNGEELLGIARAFFRAKLPYILAPMIDSRVRLFDGSLLRDVTSHIDGDLGIPAFNLFIRCVHPRTSTKLSFMGIR